MSRRRLNGAAGARSHRRSRVAAAFEHLHKAIRKDKRFTYPGFGTWAVKKRKARKGRNPKTGEIIAIAPTRTVSFKPAPNFKASL